jgi:hypothetical protein
LLTESVVVISKVTDDVTVAAFDAVACAVDVIVEAAGFAFTL